MNQLHVIGVAAVCAALAGTASAQSQTPGSEYGKFVDRARAVSPMSEFGDQVSLRDGALVIRATDIELKGTGPTIRITRSFQASKSGQDYRESSGNAFGAWELEIPRIKTITSSTLGVTSQSPTGWQVSGSTDAARNMRCSSFSGPDRITIKNDAARSWNPWEWWDGYYVVDDSGQQQALMSRINATANPGYKLMTSGNWLLNCLSATASGQPGEAFYAVAPDGTKYWFNYLVYTQADTLQKPLWSNTSGLSSNPAAETVSAGEDAASVTATSRPKPQPLVADSDYLERRYASMLVTRVEDRFGNWVTYNYSSGRLNSIDASDGRHVGIAFDANGRISTVTAGSGATARTWTYAYTGSSLGVAALTVTQPDQSTWQYTLPVLLSSDLNTQSDMQNCTLAVNDYDQFTEGNITSPAGATMTLRFNRKRFARSYVTKSCWGGDPAQPGSGFASYPREWYAWALDRRTVTGPGLPTMVWSYSYSAPVSSWYSECATPTSCASTAWTDVTDPEGNRHRTLYSTKFDETEGKLLRDEVYSASGPLLRSTDHAYATVGAGASNPYPWPVQVGNDMRKRVNTLTQGRWTPERQTVINQAGVNFTRTVNAFDVYARPANVTRSSGLGPSLTEAISYTDFPSLWVMGQVYQVVSNGQVTVENSYDSANGTLLSTKKFGITQASYTYYADGTLKTQSDAGGRATTFSNWYRGLPQSVAYPTGASESAVVDERGWVSSWTNAASYTTSYGYDAMGRLSSITPPGGFTGTSLVFAPQSVAAYGLPAGHWRQTVTKGAAVTTTYFDGFWRPVMTRTSDTGNEAGTRRVVARQFDYGGRTTYESYPQRDITSVSSTPTGTRTTYDALGRVTQVRADSELGVLTTSTSYLGGFKTQVTNPRNKVTTQTFWALDDPSKAQLAGITAPEGVTLTIARDAFGKPTAITRGGTSVGGNAGYTSSVTRRYVYDGSQRLCKTIEPEAGATVQDYDTANNIAWKAPGQNLPDASAGACNLSSVAATAKLVYGYDNLNRLKTVTYGDASPSISRTYTPDGLLETIASNGSTWTYTYNALRLPVTETLNYGGQNYGLSWGYNSAGNLSTLTYPNNSTVSYSPNALGEATSVGSHASGIAYHPNGAVAGYTLGNAIVHSLTQNTRGLPLVNRDAGVMQDQYAYDANGNVTGITDQQEGVFSRAMTYDDLDRLATANAAGVWGNASYAYDTVDNLRRANVGTRSTTINVSASTNQVTSVALNGSSANYGFDARGNLTAKGAQTFGFDLGNRMSWSSLGGSYAYDGLGRRIKVTSSDGSTRLQLYSQAGQLLWATSTGGSRPASTTAYIYLGGKQIAEVNSAAGTQYVHTDALGSPVAHTGSTGTLINRTRFEPYGYVAAGTKPSANTSVIGFTGHVQDAETDLVYMQQRYYDPIAGRFLSVDPVVTDANTGKAFGLYSYVDNNPYAKIDPDGRAPIDWIHGGLTALSFCPSICGSAFSAADGLVYLAQGDKVGAGVSFSAAAVGVVSDAGVSKAAGMLLVAKLGAATTKGAKELPAVSKAVNSNLAHAVERAVERNIFDTADAAANALRELSETIGKTGFPAGSIADTAHADRVLVPIGNAGMAVYQVAKNGTAKLKTVLNEIVEASK
ncbi:MAG: RHS repeat protein [Pelomonas sp.]|nr:RHS repeat protein [Roseateles sp.]